ncbi:MAG: nicotinate phosphoribosyltransferase [Chaenotheca gracillima]|nr:MAG: nicotinate phosphoribosyltransferase [Chaenotheca gracillima]
MATEYRPVEATESDSASLLESSLESGQTEKSEYVHPKSKSEKYRLRLVLEVCMAVVIIVLLVGVNNIRTSLGRNEDHNRIIPKFSQKLETFLPDVRFLAEDGSENARRESKRFWMKGFGVYRS